MTTTSHFQIRVLYDGAYLELSQIDPMDTSVGALRVSLLTPDAACELARDILRVAHQALSAADARGSL